MDSNKLSPTHKGTLHIHLKTPCLLCVIIALYLNDNEEPYPSLSDYHDYEPNLEFDDTELHHTPDTVNSGKTRCHSR